MASQEQYDWEVMLVNDGSKDNTITVMRQIAKQDSRYYYIDLSRNFGKENAMLAGFDYVSGDCVAIMDADLQHPRTGLGHPEALVGGNNITYSRHITAHDRIIYDIYDYRVTVLIVQAEEHYNDK